MVRQRIERKLRAYRGEIDEKKMASIYGSLLRAGFPRTCAAGIEAIGERRRGPREWSGMRRGADEAMESRVRVPMLGRIPPTPLFRKSGKQKS